MATIQLDFIADIAQATKQVADFTKGTEKQLQGLSNGFKAFGVAAAGALGAIGLAFSFKKTISEAIKLEDSINKLNFSLKSTGTFSEATSKSFVKLSEELSSVTKFGGEAVLEAAALLNTLKPLSAQGLDRATRATLDLAAAMGEKELTGTVRKVAAALNGNVAALGKQVGGFTEAEKKALTFDLILSKIEKTAQGSAVAAGNTFSGALTILTGAFNGALGAIGTFIIKNDSVKESLQSLSGIVVSINEFLKQNAATINSVVTVAFDSLGFVIRNLGTIIRIAVSAFATFVGIVSVNYVLNLVTAFQSFVFSFKALAASINLATVAITLLKAAATFGLTFLIDYLIRLRIETGSWGSVWNLVVAQVTKGGIAVYKMLLEMFQSLTKFGIKLPGAVGKYFKSLNESATKDIDGINKKLLELNKTIDTIRSKGKINIAGSGAAGGNLGRGNDTVGTKGEISDELKELRKAQGEYEDKLAKEKLQNEKQLQDRRLGLIQSGFSSVQQGAGGVAGFAGSALSVFGPQGAAAGAALQFLAQGPEAVKAQIQGFIDGIPQIIDAVTLSIPVVIETLAANSGKLITALSIQMPFIANRLSIELIKASPNIARALINSLVAEAGRVAQAIADGVRDALGKITGGLGGAGSTQGIIGGAISGARKVFGFADGGIVPGGAPFSDRVPALLTPGEYVLSRDDVKNLIDNRPKSSQPEMMTVNIQVGPEQLAKVILDLNKRGYRLAT